MTNTSDNTVKVGHSSQESALQGDSLKGNSSQDKSSQGDSLKDNSSQDNSSQDNLSQDSSPQVITSEKAEDSSQVVSSEENTETDMPLAGELTPQKVKEYLQANPEFFAYYPSLSETLKVPHQKKGSVSLVELQSEQLRDKVTELQKKLSELMSVARQNEGIYRIYADLNLKLFHCKSLQDIKTALHQTVCEELKLTDVVLHLFVGEGALPEKHRQTIVDKRLSKSDFFFGRLTQDENSLLFAEKQPQSVVIMRLKHHEEIGLVAIGSEDEGHFHPGMDTLLITQLQQFLSLLIPKVQE